MNNGRDIPVALKYLEPNRQYLQPQYFQQVDYTVDGDFINSFRYYNGLSVEDNGLSVEDNGLSVEDNGLSVEEKELITHYKRETEPEDWRDYPSKISYNIVNYILQKVWSGHPIDKPELLNEMSVEECVSQIENSINLCSILKKFPITRQPHYIYRGGGLSSFTKILNKTLKTINDQITIYSFLSTSANINVAINFAVDYLLCIKINSGVPLPFVSDILTLNYNTHASQTTESSESEVLLPYGCTFKLLDKIHNNIGSKHLDIYVVELTNFGRIETRHFEKRLIGLTRELLEIKNKNEHKKSKETKETKETKHRKSKKSSKSSKGGNKNKKIKKIKKTKKTKKTYS